MDETMVMPSRAGMGELCSRAFAGVVFYHNLSQRLFPFLEELADCRVGAGGMVQAILSAHDLYMRVVGELEPEWERALYRGYFRLIRALTFRQDPELERQTLELFRSFVPAHLLREEEV